MPLAMHWEKRLAYKITPKSGPLRSMETLLDANRGLSRDLPAGYLRRRPWLEAGKILVEAAETGANSVIHEATERLVAALETEGWMTRPPVAMFIV
jgi:hypothetical protein